MDPSYRALPVPPEFLIGARIVRKGKTALASSALLDSGWGRSVMGPGLAFELGIRVPSGASPDWARDYVFDRVGILSPIPGAKTLCSIGPVVIQVSADPRMGNQFIIGSDLLSLLRASFAYERAVQVFNLVCPTRIAKGLKKGNAIAPRPISMGTAIRFVRGSRRFKKWAEFDTGAGSTVIGEDIPDLLGFPRLTRLVRSITRIAGRGTPASVFRVPVDDIEFLDKSGRVVCRTGPIAVTTTTAFSPGSVRIGRDVMQALEIGFDLSSEARFRCMGKSGCGTLRKFSRRWGTA